MTDFGGKMHGDIARERQPVTTLRTSAEGAWSEIASMRRRLEEILREWTEPGFGEDPGLTTFRQAMLRTELALLRSAAGDLLYHVRTA